MQGTWKQSRPLYSVRRYYAYKWSTQNDLILVLVFLIMHTALNEQRDVQAYQWHTVNLENYSVKYILCLSIARTAGTVCMVFGDVHILGIYLYSILFTIHQQYTRRLCVIKWNAIVTCCLMTQRVGVYISLPSLDRVCITRDKIKPVRSLLSVDQNRRSHVLYDRRQRVVNCVTETVWLTWNRVMCSGSQSPQKDHLE